MTEVSTRRRTKSVVHEMAERGVGTACGRVLPEPWTWTDEPTTCKLCLASMAANAFDENERRNER